MEYGNYYTEETLRSLNAAYDTLYGITSREKGSDSIFATYNAV